MLSSWNKVFICIIIVIIIIINMFTVLVPDVIRMHNLFLAQSVYQNRKHVNQFRMYMMKKEAVP